MDKEFWKRKLQEKLEKEELVDRRIMEDYLFKHKDDDAEIEQQQDPFVIDGPSEGYSAALDENYTEMEHEADEFYEDLKNGMVDMDSESDYDFEDSDDA